MSGPFLRISRSHFPVTVLGPGVRLGVWVQGCPLACKGCMSRDTWDADGGVDVNAAGLEHRWRDAVDRGASGLTVSGGEPMAQPAALRAFLETVRRVSAEVGAETDILVYTGYELDELHADQLDAAGLADVLITGRYDAAEPSGLLWRGSANQSLVIQTDLGRQRYAGLENRRAVGPPLQMRVDGTGVWFVGIPPRGALAHMDRAVRSTGLTPRRVSWRQSGSDP